MDLRWAEWSLESLIRVLVHQLSFCSVVLITSNSCFMWLMLWNSHVCGHGLSSNSLCWKCFFHYQIIAPTVLTKLLAESVCRVQVDNLSLTSAAFFPIESLRRQLKLRVAKRQIWKSWRGSAKGGFSVLYLFFFLHFVSQNVTCVDSEHGLSVSWVKVRACLTVRGHCPSLFYDTWLFLCPRYNFYSRHMSPPNNKYCLYGQTIKAVLPLSLFV